MTVARLRVSLALWKRRYAKRVKLSARARQDLLEARAADLHPRQAFVDRKILREKQVDEACAKIRRRETQLAAEQHGKVRRPYERVKMSVVCQSSRNGATPRIIVLHTTEGHNRPGLSDLQGLGAFFDRAATQASSHVANDAEGFAAQYVPDSAKAWTQAALNPIALSIEQIGFASQTTWPDAQLDKTAQYIAYWSKKFGIPIVKSTSHGVCEHKMLGAAGGGHHDCGPAYPFEKVLARARKFAEYGW